MRFSALLVPLNLGSLIYIYQAELLVLRSCLLHLNSATGGSDLERAATAYR